ncbi:MAG: TlpA disulfide reductase family protein [Burkholderiales bacterium]|nr:TlpA disulfide reductase family protein [Burkholderiales bacterium]
MAEWRGSFIERRRTLKGLAIGGATVLSAGLSSPATASDTAAERAPEFALRASGGEPVLADGGRWRATYLDFWASWCAPCQLSFPWMNDVHDRFAPAGLRIVAVNLDRREADALQFLRKFPPRFEWAMDPGAQIAARRDIKAMPTALLIGADRRTLWRHHGFRLDDRAELERRLRAVAG